MHLFLRFFRFLGYNMLSITVPLISVRTQAESPPIIPCRIQFRDFEIARRALSITNLTFPLETNSVTVNLENLFTSKVGVTNVRQGFSMPPYGKEGGNTRRSYTPHTYGPTRSSAVFNIVSVWSSKTLRSNTCTYIVLTWTQWNAIEILFF